ncbi:cell division protein ZapA [Miniphocaeibacter massiliensis]|uniref:cell division protein ZapA n=1 Tax=Miniphocaeibacter massiliensis TaxID=2041841 RepID=UPI000C075B91|nr:cell division protein ZapA [Miniphocaeibacter massiliensis]
MPEKNKVDIKIFGHIYTIKSDKSEEYVQCIADKVNEKVSELRRENPKLKEMMLLNLALLYFSEENLKIDEKYKELSKKAEVPLREYNSVLNKNDTLVREITKTEEDNKNLKNSISNYKTKIEGLDKDIKKLNDDVSRKDQEIEKIESALNDVRKDYTESLKLINSLYKELEEIKGKVL